MKREMVIGGSIAACAVLGLFWAASGLYGADWTAMEKAFEQWRTAPPTNGSLFMIVILAAALLRR